MLSFALALVPLISRTETFLSPVTVTRHNCVLASKSCVILSEISNGHQSSGSIPSMLESEIGHV